MENPKILQLLEKFRDSLFKKLNETSIAGLYREQYEDIEAGRVFIFGDGEQEMLSDLKKLAKDTSHDDTFKEKLTEFVNLDNEALIDHFQKEFERVLGEISDSNKIDEIQALFIEYDYYYHYTSSITCIGQQDYPIVEEPRYISKEYDYNKQILVLANGINFEPAWLDCEALGNLDYLDINFELENLFKLHSRTLLHKALQRLDKINFLNIFKNKPFTFYINEHDCEVMMLYRLA